MELLYGSHPYSKIVFSHLVCQQHLFLRNKIEIKTGIEQPETYYRHNNGASQLLSPPVSTYCTFMKRKMKINLDIHDPEKG